MPISRIFIFFLIISDLMILGGTMLSASELPRGVPTNHWAASAVRHTFEAGLFTGKNRSFGGNRSVSRYELAAVMDRFLSIFDKHLGRVRWRTDEVIRRLHRIEKRLTRIAERQRLRKALAVYAQDPGLENPDNIRAEVTTKETAPEAAPEVAKNSVKAPSKDTTKYADKDSSDIGPLLKALRKKLGLKNLRKAKVLKVANSDEAASSNLASALANFQPPWSKQQTPSFSNPRLAHALKVLRSKR